MAHEFGLRWWADVMGWPGPPTDLQLRVLDRWLDDQFGVPGRLEHYVMRLVEAVERGQVKNPSRDLKDRVIKFKDRTALLEEKLGTKVYPPGIRPLTKEDIRQIQSDAIRARAGAGLVAEGNKDQWAALGKQGIAVPTIIKRDGTVVGPNYADAPIRSRDDVKVIT